MGDSGVVSTKTASNYPDSSMYPLVDIPENNLTLSGILVSKQRTPSTANIVPTAFGYVDSKSSQSTSAPSNPYLEKPETNCKDGQFDISLAVDKNGLPANLDWIKYIKVQTATFIDSDVFGEKSTEVTQLMIADSEESSVGKTEVNSITVNGQSLELSDGETIFNVSVEEGKAIEVSVDAANANVYINNTYGSVRSFEKTTEKNLIRVLVQSENKAPSIYYINTGKAVEQSKVTLSESSLEFADLDSTRELVATSSDGGKITWSSSDESVAIVDNGTVVPKGEGIAYIVATNESGVSASCKVTVILPTVNPSDNCSCRCHQTGFSKFIWKIQLFFYKLFKVHQICDCGINHF